MNKKHNDKIIEVIPVDIIPTPTIYQLYLTDKEFNEKIDFTIDVGDAEATNLFFNMNSALFDFTRPDTHDLMITSLQSFDVRITGIIITDRVNDTWYSQIELINTSTNEETYIDARPSDAIIIALKLNIPINIYQHLVGKKSNPEPLPVKGFVKDYYKRETLSLLPKTKLQNLIDRYVEKEDYENAQKIKDILDNKKSGER